MPYTQMIESVACLDLKTFPGRQYPASKFSSPRSLRINCYLARSGLLRSTLVSHQCGEMLKSLLLLTPEHSAWSYPHKEQQTSTLLPLCLLRGSHSLGIISLSRVGSLPHSSSTPVTQDLTEPQHELLGEGLSFSLGGPLGSSTIKLSCATEFVF